jgi:hypothetical protein
MTFVVTAFCVIFMLMLSLAVVIVLFVIGMTFVFIAFRVIMLIMLSFIVVIVDIVLVRPTMCCCSGIALDDVSPHSVRQRHGDYRHDCKCE